MPGGAALVVLLLGGVARAEPPALTPVPQLGHSGTIDALALTPDGRRLASLDRNGTVVIWDLTAGVEVARCRGFTSHQDALDVSADGRTVALGTYEAVLLFDAGTGELKRTLETERWEPKTIRLSADGRLVAASSQEPGVRLWHVGTGKLLREFGPDRRFYGGGLAFSPDRSMLATGAGNYAGVGLWDVRTGQQVRSFREHGYGITVVAYSPDGKRLVCWGPHVPLMIWEPDTDTLTEVLGGVHSGPHHVAVSDDWSTLVAVEGEEAIDVWDLTARERRRSLAKQRRSACALALDGRGQRCVSAHGRDIVLWDAGSGRRLRRLQPRSLPPRRVAFDHRGTTLAAGLPDGSVALWDAQTGRRKRILKGEGGEVEALAFSPDDAILACATAAGTILLWEVRHGELLHTLQLGPGHRAPSPAFSPDARLLAVGGYGAEVTVWDVRTGESVRALEKPPGRVASVAFSPDGRRLAAAGGRLTSRWGGGGYYLGRRGPRPSPIGTRVWDTDGWEPVWTRDGGVGRGGLAEFSPDGRWLALGDQQGVRVLDAETGESDGAPVRVPGANSTTVAPFGRTIPLDGNYYEPTLAVLSWEGREARTVRLAHGWADAACFGPDGKRIAVAGRDGVVRVLDGATGELLASLWSVIRTGTRALSPGKQWLAWTPEGYYMGSPGGESCLWFRDEDQHMLPAQQCAHLLHTPRRLRRALQVRQEGN